MPTLVGSRNTARHHIGTLGIPALIQAAMAFWYKEPVVNAEYPNKIGSQDRVAAGGEVFPGRALSFDGVDQFAYVADNGALDVNQASTDFVLSANMKFPVRGTTEYVLGKVIQDTINGRYGFWKDNGNIVRFLLQTSTGLTDIALSVDADSDTSRHHYTVHIDISNSKVYVYIDGVLDNVGGTSFTGTIGSLGNEYEFFIGAGNNAAGNNAALYTEFECNDVRIYHKDITSQLTELMAGERLGDEVAWWFCEGTDTYEVHDASGNGYHMTAANFDSTSFVEGNWQSLYNKFGYAVDVNGEALVTSWQNGTTYQYDTFASSGDDITSAIETTGNFGGAVTNSFSFISGRSYRFVGNLNRASGNAPRIYLTNDTSGAGAARSNIVTLADGDNDELLVATSSYATGYLLANVPNTTFTNHALTVTSFTAYYDTAIPPDMSTWNGTAPTQDIFGNDLTFAGQAKYNAIARDRSCFVGDGVAYFDPSTSLSVDTELDSGGITMRMQIDLSDDGLDNCIIGAASSGVAFYFRKEAAGNLEIRLYDGTNLMNADTGILSEFGVLDLMAVWSRTSIQIWLDGNKIIEDTTPTVSDPVNQNIRFFSRGGSGLFRENKMHWLRYHNDVLTWEEEAIATPDNQWEFCEGSGTTVYDVSGNGNHLTGVNVDETNWGVIDTPDEDYLAEHGANVVGKFNGTDDYIEISPDIIIDYTKSTTISFRLKRFDEDTADWILGNSGTSSYNQIYFTAGGIFAIESQSNGDIAQATLSVDDTDWHEYVITINNGVVTMSQDGTALTVTGSLSNNVVWNRIGALSAFYANILLANLTIIHDGVTVLNGSIITGIDAFDTFGTWSGTGIHSAIIPSLADKSTDALGQELEYAQTGKNLIPHTYLSMPENVYELYAGDQEERYEGGLMDAGKGTFNSGTESWVASGNNTIENDNGALKITYVDNAIGAITYFRESGYDLNQNLVVGDDYKLIARVKVSSGGSVVLYVAGPNETTSAITSTEWVDVEINFTATTTTTNYLRLGQMDAGEIVWIDQWELFHKTTQTGQNLVTNGGARNAIGALTTTDWEKTSGLNDILAFEDYASTIDGATKVNTLGVDRVNNGDFSVGTGWNFGVGSSIGSGVLSWDGSQVAASGTWQTPLSAWNAGDHALVEFDVTAISAGQVRVRIGGTYSQYFTTVGKKRMIIEVASYGNIHGIYADSDFIGSVDNFTVKYITTANASVGEDDGVLDSGRLIDQIPQGSELVTNGDFANWTGDDPDNWVIQGTEDANNYVTEDANGANIVTDGSGLFGIRQNSFITVGKYYLAEIVVHSHSGADVGFNDQVNDLVTINAPGTYTAVFRSAGTGVAMWSSSAYNVVISSVSVKELQVLGDDLVTNGSFATDSDWDKPSGLTIGSGVASCSSVSGAIYQAQAKTEGWYLCKVTISNYSAGNLKFRSNDTNYYGEFSSNGTHTALLYNDGSYDYNTIQFVGFTGDIDNFSVHKLTWGRQITDDSTNYAGFQYALPVDEFDFIIPVDYTAESIVAQQFHDGLADGWTLEGTGNSVTSIVNGNGFASNAQRIEFTGDTSFSWLSYTLNTDILSGQEVYLSVKAKTSGGFNFYLESGDKIFEQDNDIDDVETITGSITATSTRSNLRLYFDPTTTPAAGDWIEISELELRHVIDEEFYEPESLGGDPVIVSVNYLLANPWRYLTRYVNATDRRDLILLEANNDLDYTDHEKLLKFTKNDS